MSEATEETRRRPGPAENGRVLTDEQRQRLSRWTTRYPHPQMGLIEAMREVQQWHGSVTLEDDAYLAELFGVPRKVVREVATFYPYFTEKKAGRYRISVCHNLSCTLAGAGKILERLEKKLGVPEGETTPDGLFSFEASECIGACENAPAWLVNDVCQGRAEEGRLDEILAGLRERGVDERPLPPTFVYAPEGGEDRRLLTRHFGNPRLHELAVYRELGGYRALEKARTMKPADIVEEVKKSNLRGLGGAGFPVGFKWSTVPPKDKVKKPHYMVVNADESEPGCYKDRVLLERSPHQVIEGAMITALAIEADAVFIFIRGEYERQYRILQAALAEASEAGLLGKLVPQLMRGANAYISGADTALLETMEGKKAWPRQPPPFPTGVGVLGCPTVVNNVETVSMVPHVLNLGGESFAARGFAKSGGTAVFSVSGHVARPGLYEFPMGTPLREVIAAAGGVPAGRRVKAVIPGGTSTPVLTAQELDVKMDFDSLRSVGSFLGAGGLIVLDETTDMVEVLHIIERFLWHESCGQCTPCREGSGWLTAILERLLAGGGADGDLKNIDRVGENITGKVICALGDTVGMVARSMLKKFPADFESRLKGARP